MFEIYLELADSDEPRKFLDFMHADTMGAALQKASEYYEVPSYDLVAVQIDKNRLFNPLQEK